MTQILKSLQLPITSSTPGTPPSGFGAIYASSSNKFYFKNSSGIEFDLTTSNGYVNILYYTGSAIGDGTTKTYTWSPTFTGLKYIEVCCVGAGGGGGSGRKSTLGPTFKTLGGMGGGGGAVVWATFDANILDSSYNISIGAGGAGGIGQTTNNTNGNTGLNGGTSSFGTLVVARGGNGGAGGGVGGNFTTAGGRALQCTPAGIPYAINGCTTARLSAQPPGAPNNASIALASNQTPPIFFSGAWLNSADPVLGSLTAGFGGGAGGYGGSYNPNLPEINSASRGSNGYQFDTLIVSSGVIGSGGSINGGNATSPTDNMITTLLQFTGSTTLYGLGGGGHGGGTGIAGNGGNGSNGGLYGAGGGGGGAIYNNTALSSSGAGASGSSGLCIVVEFY